jgi:hypothetical protein
MVIDDVSSLDIYDEYQKKHDDVRSIPQMNMTVFILVQTLSKSNSHMFSLTRLLILERMNWLRPLCLSELLSTHQS